MPRPCLAALLCLALLAPLAATSAATLHPKDGPDVDLRYLVGDGQVRVTMIFNLAFIDDVTDAYREHPDHVDPVEYDGLRDTLLELVRTRNAVVLDGVAVNPVPVSFEVLDADPALVPLFPGFGARALTQVQLVVDHPSKSPPRRLDLTWGAYPTEPAWAVQGGAPGTMTVSGRLLVGGEEVLIDFTEREPGFTWHRPATGAGPRFESVPDVHLPLAPRLHLASLLALLALAGALLLMGAQARRRAVTWALPVAGLAALVLWPVLVVELPVSGGVDLDDEAAIAVFEPLHANIYRAFDYGAESDVYDALARSVDGPLLQSLYDQVYRGLVMAEHGGAVTRVQAVRPGQTVVESRGLLGNGRPGFRVRTTWEIDGVVRHWGHTHWRTNAHEARYDVAATAEGWRITASTMLDQRRIAGSPIEDGPAPVEATPPRTFVLPPGEDL